MTTTTVLISELKPIVISFKSGQYKISTHDNLSIEITLKNFKIENQRLPLISESEDHISIGGQPWKDMWNHNERTMVEIVLPINSNFNCHITAGTLNIDGQFDRYDAELTMGEIVVKPNQSTKEANVKVGLGSIKFTSIKEEEINFEKNSMWTKKFLFNQTCNVNLRLGLIGGVIFELGLIEIRN